MEIKQHADDFECLCGERRLNVSIDTDLSIVSPPPTTVSSVWTETLYHYHLMAWTVISSSINWTKGKGCAFNCLSFLFSTFVSSGAEWPYK